jgi:hypothetical protein
MVRLKRFPWIMACLFFRFQDEATCEEILENKLWHVANKPLILSKWQPGMQVLKLSLTSVSV